MLCMPQGWPERDATALAPANLLVTSNMSALLSQVARGVDLSRVNLVANLDLPRDAATYMHRVGRTGRYGTRGVAVTFVTPAELARLTADLEGVAGGRVRCFVRPRLGVKPGGIAAVSRDGDVIMLTTVLSFTTHPVEWLQNQ